MPLARAQQRDQALLVDRLAEVQEAPAAPGPDRRSARGHSRRTVAKRQPAAAGRPVSSADAADAKTAALEEVTWDLSHLLDGAGRGRRRTSEATVGALLDRADELAEGFADRARGQGRRARRRRACARRWSGSPRSPSWPGAPPTSRTSRFAADTEDPANGALMQMVSERATAIQTKLLFFELEWVEVDDDRAEELLADRGPGVLPPLPADGAPLPPAPAEQARGDDRRPSSR